MARDHVEPLTNPLLSPDIWSDDNVVFHADAIVAAWVEKHMGEPMKLDPDMRAVGIVRDAKLAAGVVYDRYNGVNVEASVAVTDPQCLTRNRLRLWLEYPFKHMGVRRITSVVAESNDRALRFNAQIGMRFEARLANAAHDGSDLIVLRMFAEECPWIDYDGR